MTLRTTNLSDSEIDEIFDIFQDLTNRYAQVKKIYIEAEESDPDMQTNLQPLNEFKATLDHLFRMIGRILSAEEMPAEGKLDQVRNESRSIRGHLCRAFFDIADACSIDIREQISKGLEPYSTEAIQLALPDYYPLWRPQIEKLSHQIAGYRLTKGNIDSKRELELFNEYQLAIEQLIIIRSKISERACSLKEAEERLNGEKFQKDCLDETMELSRRRFDFRLAMISAMIGAIAGAMITILIRLILPG